MKLFTLIAVAALAGCASTPPMGWTKPGATENDYLTDSGQCRAQAAGVSGVTLMQLVVVEQNCMMGKGWRRAPRT